MYLLDTDHISMIQKGSAEGQRIQARLDAQEERVRLSIVSFEEQARGRLAEIARAHSSVQWRQRYALLSELLDVYCATPILQFDDAAIEQFQRLWLMRSHVGAMDLKIAAIAFANHAVLLTRKSVDFSKVPDLRFEDWSA